MKRIFFFLFVLLAPAISAGAQTFIGGGVSVNRSSSYDPSPAKRGDGGQVYAGGYVEGGYQFPAALQARFLAEYSSDVALRSIFTSDAPTGRMPKGEFRFRPEVRLRPGCKEAKFCLFLAGGADYFRQRFDGAAGRYAPAAGLNPTFTVGAEFGEYNEVGFTRLFTDKTSLNRSELHGYRLGYSHVRPLYRRLRFKLAGEVDYVIYRDSIGPYVATYTKRDAVFKVRFGFTFERE